jgi:integrase
MPRRGENIRKRKDGRWECRAIVGRSPEGKAEYQSIYGCSYAEVKEKKRNIALKPERHNRLANSEQIYVFSAQGILVQALCVEWLNDVIGLKSSSYSAYHGLIHKHIVPYFQGMGAEQLTCDTVNRFIRDKCEGGRLDKSGGLSEKYVRDMALLLLQIICYGQRKGYITGFDYTSIQLPKVKNEQVPVLSTAEHDRLVLYSQTNVNPTTIGILVALFTGIRLGELCALTWRDIEPETGVLHITKTLQRIKDTEDNTKAKTKIIIDTPKSACSMRFIPIPNFLLQILKRFKGNQDIDCYILSGTRKYVEPRLFQKRYKKILELAKVTYVNVHVLRHTFATRAVERGFDIKNLSEILGHSNVRFTLDKYVHGSVAQKKQYMEKMAVGY